MHKNIKLAVSEELIARLIRAGILSVEDFQCLDSYSKQSMHRIYLKSLINNFRTKKDL
ncbi:hypothetical protein [Teredinibacter sp. KSP-S5-2]|uniref:hypothetical protein n=1 Tax=Teredinibacter sp. KSP-S5-2 TaxID=3034506 RepID=UPI002934E3F1|nr:hypothetical protein [Teredinibacter sp. KSP-S5-2]WNO10098.1 hypothetical protein P5V12_02830 [Teredinibacter sp. KSP-S5-2]